MGRQRKLWGTAEQGRTLPVDPDLLPGDPAAPGAGHVRAKHPFRRTRRRADPRVLGAIALGGALGAPARYGVSVLVDITPGSFPWGTFWTNLVGSFALGFVLVFLVRRYPASRHLRPFVATGFLGAFTTYSTLAVETDLLIRNGHAGIALIYATASLAAGVTAAWSGIALARSTQRSRA